MMRDIVNRDRIGLDNCENEPIRVPGSIQPHGFLLALNPENGKIVFCSANVSDFLPVSAADVLNSDFQTVFGDNTWQQLTDSLARDTGKEKTVLERMPLLGTDFNITWHHNGRYLILEAEVKLAEETEPDDFYRQTAGFLTNMSESLTLKELCQHVAQTTRDITGYDRVMVYRFDQHYNGEIFAESHVDGVESFLGLHYPHTDIPSQARELYLQNLLRLIVDIGYEPVPVLTSMASASHQDLDLSHSILRSTSPIHVQYLQNMGVGATLTVSLIHDGKLWGLIACHHYSPLNLSPQKRLAAKLQGQFLTSQIDVRQLNEEYDLARKCNAHLEKISSVQPEPYVASLQEVANHTELLSLCNASGASILFRDQIFTLGDTPDHASILKLSHLLHQITGGTHFHTDHIQKDLTGLEFDCSPLSGLNYHCLGTDAAFNIIWYRQETVSEVHWAGDPSKAIEKDANGLSPRKSFELWKEFVKCKSKPWKAPELNAAANYAHTLQRHMNLILLNEEGRRNQELNEILKETNSELENINWISTHDLQEPLRKIQLMASRLLTRENEGLSGSVMDSLTRMNHSANRMQRLLIDILKYTKIRHTNAALLPVQLSELVQKCVDELEESPSEQNISVHLADLPEISGIPFLLHQLFANLFSNSVKYSKPDQEIKIEVWHDEEPVKFPGSDSDNRY